jgi:hypothetical protein
MERNDMKAEIIYGTDEKGRVYIKYQLEGEVLAIHRHKSIQDYDDDKRSAKITEHSWGTGHIHVSSGNSHHSEPMPNIAWSSESPVAPVVPVRRGRGTSLSGGYDMSWLVVDFNE